MEQYEVRNVDEVSGLSARLHDVWLDIADDLVVNGGEVVLTGYDDVVKIEDPPYRTWGPIAWSHKTRPELLLTVRSVVRVDVDDEAHIGGVSVNTLVYDARASTLAIVPNTPTDVTMYVSAIDVTLAVTDAVRRRGRHWGLNLHRSAPA